MELRAVIDHAEDEEGQQLTPAALDCRHSKVQHQIDCREHQNITREHGAEDRKTVKGDVAHGGEHEEFQQCGDVQQATRTDEQCRNQHDEKVGEQQRDDAGELGREEHGLPAEGEAVHHAAAFALVEIVEHGHGGDDTHKGGNVHDRNAFIYGA